MVRSWITSRMCLIQSCLFSMLDACKRRREFNTSTVKRYQEIIFFLEILLQLNGIFLICCSTTKSSQVFLWESDGFPLKNKYSVLEITVLEYFTTFQPPPSHVWRTWVRVGFFYVCWFCPHTVLSMCCMTLFWRSEDKRCWEFVFQTCAEGCVVGWFVLTMAPCLDPWLSFEWKI